MKPVRISHPKQLKLSSWSAPGRSRQASGSLLSWESEEHELPQLVSCIADLGALQGFNSIEIGLHPSYPRLFPSNLRFEVSDDGHCWESLIQETDYSVRGRGAASWQFPLVSSRYLKLLILVNRKRAESYFAAFGEFRLSISGSLALSVSSELDRLWVKENLLDSRPDYGWSSAPRSQEEFVRIDLGTIHPLSEIRLLSKDDPETFFPEAFQFLYSEDDIAWHLLLEETQFLSEAATWYRWRFRPLNARYLQIAISKGGLTREGKRISQIIEMELYAVAEYYSSGPTSAPPLANPASVIRPGLVRLALDGENRQGLAVQASDRRLQEATTEFKGIVELAADGEENGGTVVQGSDRRLRYASEELPGIARLARLGEQKSGYVVQSDDPRLRLASEKQPGIVELAANGETRKGAAVQGDDVRLQLATVKRAGIVLLAEDGASHPNQALQSNDRRLRAANAEQSGLVRFARHGEVSRNKALQSDDPRIYSATTERKGIVELAADGEKREGVAVQGSDHRLRNASESSVGIVRLASKDSRQAGAVVQANDPRLIDARRPLPHAHDYASRIHDYSDHSGTIRIEAEQGKRYRGLAHPPLGHAPITGINRGEGAGLVGQGKNDGIVGSGDGAGAVGLSRGQGSGIVGAARSGSGGIFVSDRSYGVIAGGKLREREIGGSPFALLARGVSHFKDTIFLQEGTACIALYFPVDNSDILSPGDLLVASEAEGRLRKSHSYGESSVVGVVVEKAALVLNPPPALLPSEQPKDTYHSAAAPRGHALVAVQGIVDIRVAIDAKVDPGDLLVSSLEAGSVEPMDHSRYRPGIICARSLESSAAGRRLISALLTCG